MNDNHYGKSIKYLFQELLYFGVNKSLSLHGQFNNIYRSLQGEWTTDVSTLQCYFRLCVMRSDVSM